MQAFLSAAILQMPAAPMNAIAVLERNGRAYVDAVALAEELGVAIKSLPGQDLVAACSRQRCAVVVRSMPQRSHPLLHL